jgi:selenocysteine lyase/cysteine desulfurase
MNAGYGLGLMRLKPEFLQQHTPRIGGFGSFRPKESGKWEYSPGIPSYEPGHLNMAGFLALKEAIQEKNQIGMEPIQLHNSSLIARLIDGLRSLQLLTLGEEGIERRTGIACFQGDEALLDALKKRDLRVSLRKGFIRVSPHFYNSSEDIDTLLNALEDIRH